MVRRADVEEREPLARLKTGRVGLSVIFLGRSIAFYRSIFAFETIEEVSVGERQFAFRGYDGDTVLTPGNRIPTSAQTTRAFITCVPSDDVATVRRVEAALRAMGAHLPLDGSGPSARTLLHAVFFLCDPDGVRL